MLFVGYALRHGGHFMKRRAKRKKHKPKGQMYSTMTMKSLSKTDMNRRQSKTYRQKCTKL